MRPVALLLGLALTACSTAPPVSEPPPPPATAVVFGQCTALPKGSASLPEIALPCFTGGEQVQLRQLGGPLVVNLWASWCAPCREELPAFQRLADSGKVPVLGVVTEDRRQAAESLAVDLGVRFPAVFDADGSLRRALGEGALPVTLFVDAQGKVTRYVGPALTDATLAQLVRERLGRS